MSLSDGTHISCNRINKKGGQKSSPANKTQTLQNDIACEEENPSATYTIDMSADQEGLIRVWWTTSRVNQKTNAAIRGRAKREKNESF